MLCDSRKTKLAIFLLSLLIITLLTACSLSGTKSEKSEKTQPATETAEVAVGQPLRVGDAEWTVQNVDKQASIGDLNDKPNGVYVILNLNVKNFANTEQQVEGIEHQLKVTDSQGRETSQTDKLIIPLNGWPQHIMGTQLGGGASLNGFVVFDVPVDATGLKLKVYGWALGEKQEGYINLGI